MPDGSILFSDSDRSRLGLLRYNPETRQVEPVRGAEALVNPKCSRQGDVLASSIGESGSRWKVRRRGTEEWRDLGRETRGYPNWTWDGRSICALSHDFRIECLNIDERRMTVLADTSPLELVAWVWFWMGLDAEDRPLVAAAPGEEEPTTLYALDWEAP